MINNHQSMAIRIAVQMYNNGFYKSLVKALISNLGWEELVSEIQFFLIDNGYETYPELNDVRSYFRRLFKAYGIKTCQVSFDWLQEKVEQHNDDPFPKGINYSDLHKVYCSQETYSTMREADPRIEQMLSYYELDNFKGVCDKFDLPKSEKLRKLFSAACPKPDETAQRGGRRATHKIRIRPEWTAQDIVENFDVHKATAYRAIQRGYLYYSEDKIEQQQCFSARRVMDKLLNSQYRDEIISTLWVSKSFSFYFKLNGVKYRVSNHKSKSWEDVKIEKWSDVIDINPTTYENFEL